MSGAVPPPAARPLGPAAGVPRPVCPGRGWCGCRGPAPAQQRALLRAVVARCGGGRRASPGGVPRAAVRGVWVEALSLPQLPALWAGCGGPLSTCCWRGRGCVQCVWCLCGACVLADAWRCGVCRFAWCCLLSSAALVPPSLVLAVCLPCPLPRGPLLLGCWLPSFSFCCSGALYPFLYSPFVRPPPLRALSSLPPPLCLSRSFSLPTSLVSVPGSSFFSLAGSCETEEG